jgi:hypothetical protein
MEWFELLTLTLAPAEINEERAPHERSWSEQVMGERGEEEEERRVARDRDRVRVDHLPSVVCLSNKNEQTWRLEFRISCLLLFLLTNREVFHQKLHCRSFIAWDHINHCPSLQSSCHKNLGPLPLHSPHELLPQTLWHFPHQYHLLTALICHHHNSNHFFHIRFDPREGVKGERSWLNFVSSGKWYS